MSSRRRTLAGATTSVVMVFIDQTVVGVVLPNIADDLDVSRHVADWVAVTYLLVFGALVIAGGVLADRVGPRKVFLVGVLLFGAGSLVVAIAPGILVAIVGRGLQGVGAAASQPASLTLVTDAYPKSERGKALSIYWGVAMVALVIGPVLGGILTEFASWRWVFVINLPVIAIAASVLPRGGDEPRELPEVVDWAQLVVYAIGAAAIVVALQTASTDHVLAAAIGAVVAALAFPVVVHRARTRTDAPIPSTLLEQARTRVDLLSVFVVRFALAGATVQIAVSARSELGYTSLEVSLLVVVMVIPMIAADLVGGRWYDHAGIRPTNSAGLVALAIGWLFVAVAFARDGTAWLVGGLVLVGVGSGLATPAGTDLLSAAPEAIRGRFAGATQSARQVAGGVGVAALGWASGRLGTDSMAVVAAVVVGVAAAVTVGTRVGAATASAD